MELVALERRSVPALSAGAVDAVDCESNSVAVAGWVATLQRRLPTTFDPVSQCRKILRDCEPDRIVATGYGRALVVDMVQGAEKIAAGPSDGGNTPGQYNELCLAGVPVETITEIKAHALGAYHLFPQARTVLDIGGQDTKAISLAPNGKVMRFEMNDRCAAGTGKFLEYTATVFQMDVAAFGAYALLGSDAPLINSMCTVFAETEATSLMAQGVRPENIALGLHQSIVRRTVNMLRRVGLEAPVVFAGGVANNPCIRKLLQYELFGPGAGGAFGGPDMALLIPEEPDMCGALGAALWGAQQEG